MVPLFAISIYFDWIGANSSSGVRALELLSVMVISFVGFFLTARLLHIEEVSMGKELISAFMGRNKSAE